MKVAILGYGMEGQSSYRYFSSLGYDITICDQDTSLKLPANTEAVLGDNYLDDLNRFDLIVRTAGLKPSLILDKNPGLEPKITSQLNEFLKETPTRHIF